jgi:arylsulfatase A-like enzyme
LIKKITFILILFFFVIACKNSTTNKSLAVVHKDSDGQPNIIVILLDDAGYADFGFMGSKDLDTPEIDSLAKSGVIFTDAHVSATVCAPSRAGIITGKYQQRFGFEANHTGDKLSGDIGLSDDIVTISDIFQQNNYNTTAIGKWHLGENESDHPNKRGFDDFYGFLAGGRSYFPLKKTNEKNMLQHNGEKVNFHGYMTDVLGDYSVKFVEENRDRPFFMYLAYNAVHTPMHAKDEDLAKYSDHPRQYLAAMTWSLDQNIGKLRKKLKELKILDNTLIFFLSDNGGAHNNNSSNGTLKGWKGNKFEGGHRVPFVLSWPDKIKGNRTFDGLTSSLDIFSTSMAAANIKTDSTLLLDGSNLLSFMKEGQKSNPHKELYWRKLEEAGARIGDHKIIRLDNFGYVMYDLKKDVSETNDISKKDKISFDNLVNKLNSWESKMIAPLWKEDKDWMEVTNHIHQRLMQNKEVLYNTPAKKTKHFKKK